MINLNTLNGGIKMLFQKSEKDIQFLIELAQRACKSSFENLHFNDVVRDLQEQANSKTHDKTLQRLYQLCDEKDKEIEKLKKAKKGK